jgi:hypothetical protein
MMSYIFEAYNNLLGMSNHFVQDYNKPLRTLLQLYILVVVEVEA